MVGGYSDNIYMAAYQAETGQEELFFRIGRKAPEGFVRKGDVPRQEANDPLGDSFRAQ